MNIAEIVRTLAPTIATALGGPAAGLAIDFIAEKLSMPKEEVTSLVTGGTLTGEQREALARVDADFRVRMAELNIRVIESEQKDRESAREREARTGDLTQKWIAAAVFFTWASINYLAITHALPDRDIGMRVLGTLDAAVLAVLYYYFGTSHSSSLKNWTKGDSK